MSRAAIMYKTKDELRDLTLSDLNKYIKKLKIRAQTLGGVPQKEILKLLAVAEKLKKYLT